MIPKTELPREKLVKSGIESLSDQELLCLILRSGTSKYDMFDLAHRILLKVGGLNGLATARLGELLDVDGIKLAKACSIIASIELSKRILYVSAIPKTKVSSMQEIYQMIVKNINDPFQEQMFLVCINAQQEVICCLNLFKGTASSHLVHPRDIFREAVKNNAEFIVIAHNHPSGDATPSKQDIVATQEIAALGEKMGIHVVDHLIIGRNGFLSLKYQGYM
ncbi:MAG: DNA repair protein RadC [Bacilli bacterium]|nr:DNA repair protein RadC [Bacilli bacterium]MDD4066250.1 DNA repair protein RadC [Bacilli bacterium]